jgi:hypothetical protein
MPDSYKQYDSFRNEWDINDAFDPEGKGQAEDDNLMDLYNDDMSGNAIPDVSHTAGDNLGDIVPDADQQVAPHDIVPDVGQQASLNIPVSTPTAHDSTGKIAPDASQNVVARDSTCDTESLDQVLPFRFGFVLTDINLHDPPIECVILPWDTVHAILSDMESPLDE